MCTVTDPKLPSRVLPSLHPVCQQPGTRGQGRASVMTIFPGKDLRLGSKPIAVHPYKADLCHDSCKQRRIEVQHIPLSLSLSLTCICYVQIGGHIKMSTCIFFRSKFRQLLEFIGIASRTDSLQYG